jgi:uncharacterized protein (DUF697 family)
MSQYETETEAYEYGELGQETGEYEFGQQTGEYEFGQQTGEYEFGEVGGPLHEVQEAELAAELLEITNEQELEEFLGNIFKGVSRAVGGFMRSPVGAALGSALKGIAKQALPLVGGALGSFVAPGVGTALGSKLGSMAGDLFEVELESMDREQGEFEVARKYVQLAANAAQNAALAPPNVPPGQVAQQAIAQAAQRYAPGLLPSGGNGAGAGYGQPVGAYASSPGGYGGPAVRPRSGRWIRRGRRIIVLGV